MFTRVCITRDLRSLPPLLLLTLLLGATPDNARAQSSTTDEIVSEVVSAEGIVGDIEKHRRAPVILASTVTSSGVVKILVDSYTPNEELRPYPVQFDFFINRQLFASQIRSLQQPGPIGVDIGSDVAVAPFDYTIVAHVLHPSRTFTSVLTGSVEKSDPLGFATCSATITGSAGSTYTAAAVEGALSTSGKMSITFNGSDGTTSKLVTLTGSVAGTSFAGELKIEGVLESTAVTGSVVAGDRFAIDDLEASSNTASIECK